MVDWACENLQSINQSDAQSDSQRDIQIKTDADMEEVRDGRGERRQKDLKIKKKKFGKRKIKTKRSKQR